MNEKNETPIANALTVFREEFDDWAILFDPDTGKAFGINPIGVQIWKNLDGKHNLADIVERIKCNFSEVPEDVELHVKDFLKEVVDMGFAGYEV